MKIRTIYFKVKDMKQAVDFWEDFLEVTPHKTFDEWHEFMIGDLRLGLLLNDFEGDIKGCSCVPVFEYPDEKLEYHIERAKALGAKIVHDGLNDPDLLSIVFTDPSGNEFEVSKFH